MNWIVRWVMSQGNAGAVANARHECAAIRDAVVDAERAVQRLRPNEATVVAA